LKEFGATRGYGKARRIAFAAARGLAAGFLLFAGVAHAADRWQAAGSGAVAILPAPDKAARVVGGSLHCAEQRWRFFFRLEPDAVPAGWTNQAEISVGSTVFQSQADEAGGSLAVVVPVEILESLKAGARMALAAGTIVAAEFSLRGSSDVIEAIQPRCSQVDMSAYVPVVLSETGPDVATVKTLLADEARLFRAATGRQPAYAAARLDLAGGRTLLFSTLCGSSGYYGRSGCSLFGHAAEAAAVEWRQVFNTEGLLLHTDPAVTSGGWPSLVTLPLSGATEPDHWAWNGGEYETVDMLIGGDQPDLPEGDTE
jgi:hypothetical protein